MQYMRKCHFRNELMRGNRQEETARKYTHNTSGRHTCYTQIMKFKVGLSISRTNADFQWNPVYKVFHRNSCYGNDMIRR